MNELIRKGGLCIQPMACLFNPSDRCNPYPAIPL